ncbi:MAG TPA: Crp/Fnr family transcriptional regulator [Parafilimonas sp.]|jgi:CRP-like cAMP-binding protein|nr:Crp/Fnr family transcriptional regulator [Parafilimonas sp.]
MELDNIPGAYERFRKKMMSYAPITDGDFRHMAEMMHEKHCSKGEVLLKEGQVCTKYYFVYKGCIRSFGLEDGREINVKFYFEDDTACDFASFRNELPSEFYLVAMEDCIVFYATKAEAVPVLQAGSSFQMFLFRFFQQLFLTEEEHSNSFKLLSPEERYNFLVESKPEYLQRIPLLHLAPYLGMSRETLTRIRKKF